LAELKIRINKTGTKRDLESRTEPEPSDSSYANRQPIDMELMRKLVFDSRAEPKPEPMDEPEPLLDSESQSRYKIGDQSSPFSLASSVRPEKIISKMVRTLDHSNHRALSVYMSRWRHHVSNQKKALASMFTVMDKSLFIHRSVEVKIAMDRLKQIRQDRIRQ